MPTDAKPKGRWLGAIRDLLTLLILGFGIYATLAASDLKDRNERLGQAWLVVVDDNIELRNTVGQLQGALAHSDGQLLFWQRQTTVAGSRWLICDNERNAMREECLRRAGFWR